MAHENTQLQHKINMLTRRLTHAKARATQVGARVGAGLQAHCRRKQAEGQQVGRCIWTLLGAVGVFVACHGKGSRNTSPSWVSGGGGCGEYPQG